MKSSGLIITINYIKHVELNELFPNLQIINLNDFKGITYFKEHEVICVVVDLDYLPDEKFKYFLKSGKNKKLKYVFVSSNQEIINKFKQCGDTLLKAPHAIENKIVELHYQKNKQMFSGYLFNYENRTISNNSEIVKVRNTPFLIFNYLVKNKNRVCTREEIMRATANYKFLKNEDIHIKLSEQRKIDVHINYLRNTIADSRLKTVINEGYVFEDENKIEKSDESIN